MDRTTRALLLVATAAIVPAAAQSPSPRETAADGDVLNFL
jgi:hypothetical protein